MTQRDTFVGCVTCVQSFKVVLETEDTSDFDAQESELLEKLLEDMAVIGIQASSLVEDTDPIDIQQLELFDFMGNIGVLAEVWEVSFMIQTMTNNPRSYFL
jgi:hydrogenase maturation factor